MWDLAMTQTELGQHAEAAVHYRTLLTYANEEKTANVYALHNALGRALRATGDAAGASLELAQAESSACAASSMTVPCAIIKLNLADAEQVQQHLAEHGVAIEHGRDEIRRTEPRGVGDAREINWLSETHAVGEDHVDDARQN